MSANYRRKRRGMQRQMPLLCRDAHLDWMNAKPSQRDWHGQWVSACLCYLNPVFSLLCFMFVSLMQVHSCKCELTRSSPKLPWPLYTLNYIGRHPIYCLLIQMLPYCLRPLSEKCVFLSCLENRYSVNMIKLSSYMLNTHILSLSAMPLSPFFIHFKYLISTLFLMHLLQLAILWLFWSPFM